MFTTLWGITRYATFYLSVALASVGRFSGFFHCLAQGWVGDRAPSACGGPAWRS